MRSETEQFEFAPRGNLPAQLTPEQSELFSHEFTVEANLVQFSSVFPAHSPNVPLFSARFVDTIKGGGLGVTSLTTATVPYKVKGELCQDRVPGDFEKKIFYSIVSVWVKNGKPADGTVTFTIASLLDQLGLSMGGKGYKMVRDGIARISRARITIEGSFVKAPDMNTEKREFSLFDDFRESTARRGRKSANGLNETDFYRVKLNTAIVNNMIHDYSVVIQVKDYTSASSRYYRRLVDIIEFELQKGSACGKSKVEFIITTLAKNLPLEGNAISPSTILKRLSTSLRELETLGGYKIEITAVDRNSLLTVYSKAHVALLNKKMSFQETIDDFLKSCENFFETPLYKIMRENEKSIIDFLSASDEQIEFEGKTLYRTIHLLDLLVYQYFIVGQNKKLNSWAQKNNDHSSVTRIARALLNDSSRTVKKADGYEDYEIRLKKKLARLTKNEIETKEQNKLRETRDEATIQAKRLLASLTKSGKEIYVARIKKEMPKVSDEFARADRTLMETILEDMLDGSLDRKHFKIEN